MFLELAKPVSLLACMISLLAVFHAAFLGSETDLRQRILDALAMLLMAFAISLASGMIFTQKRRATSGLHLVWPVTPIDTRQDFNFDRVIASFPMRIFFWATSGMAAFFLAAWFIETYCIPLRNFRY